MIRNAEDEWIPNKMILSTARFSPFVLTVMNYIDIRV